MGELPNRLSKDLKSLLAFLYVVGLAYISGMHAFAQDACANHCAGLSRRAVDCRPCVLQAHPRLSLHL